MRASKARASKRAFTLIEIIVVITVLTLVSIMVAPRLLSMKRTSDRQSVISGIRRIFPDARERAIQSGRSTQVVYDEGEKQLQIQDLQDDGSASTIVRQSLGEDIEPQTFQLSGKDTTANDFKLIFTSDGHSNGGGIAFQDFSIYTDAKGSSRFVEGPLPLPEDQTWEAGDLEQRI